MYMPSITACSLVLLAGAALAFQLIRLRRSRHTVFNGGILLCLGLLIAAALPLVPWTELAEEALDQAVAALHALEVAYVILTL